MLFLDFKIIYKKDVLAEFFLYSCSSNWELIIPNEIPLKCNDEVVSFILGLNAVVKVKPVESYKITMDSYLVSLLHYVIQTSVFYRCLLANQIIRKKTTTEARTKVRRVLIYVNVIPPKQEMIDHKGNELFEISCLERRELDIAMAWLSTLGGAFSALGDSIKTCATMAGKISVRQLEIAVRLGDPHLVARCKLYMALSLIQKHKFKLAKDIVQAQYLLACQGTVKDNRLKSMCLGIWTKLKYDRRKFKEDCRKNLISI